MILGSLSGAGLAAGFTDRFAERQVLEEVTGVVSGNNAAATIEPGEPRHAGKTGGHSLWVSWIAPGHGLLNLSTRGSTFDTLVGVYTSEDGDDPPLERLREAAEDDDDGVTELSSLALGVRAGERYEIAVDGYRGAVGEVRIELGFTPSGGPLATIVRRPGDQSLRAGDTLILTVDVAPVPELELRWYLNGKKVDDGEEATLVIPRMGPEHTGLYELELRMDDLSFFSAGVEVQLNSEGGTAVLARNKLADAEASGLDQAGAGRRVAAAAAAGAGVSRGYNGSQVFNTAYATRDPAEPQHCGRAGGASYWFSYQPPEDGRLHLDTTGSDYDTVLAVYTYDPPLTGYGSLRPVQCDDNGGPDGRAASLEFAAEAVRNYLIVVDGVGGSAGTAHLNYSLVTAVPPPSAPVITRSPQSQTVAPGGPVSMTVVAQGERPLQFQWSHDDRLLSGETNASLLLPVVQAADAGRYQVEVTNPVATVPSAVAVLVVQSAPTIRVASGSGVAQLSFPAVRGYQYWIEAAPDAGAAVWSLVQSALTDAGGLVQVETPLAGPMRLYRLMLP